MPVAEERQPDSPTSDDTALSHLVVSTLFLGLGAALVVLTQVGSIFPDLFTGPLTYGRLRPAAMAAVMLGWLVPAFVGGAYYVLPRLTGTRLWNTRLADLGLVAVAGLTLIGMVVVMLGLGDGVEPLGFPAWLDVPVVISLLIPLVVSVQTVRRRVQQGGYVSIWFVLAGLAWLPLLYTVGNLPGLAALGTELGAAHFTAGFITLWVATMGSGIALYTVVKASDRPLAGRQLAQAGFWSLAFAGSWAGVSRLAFGPTPDWVDPVAAVFGLAFPVGAVAVAATLALTLEGDRATVAERPAVASALAGSGLMVVTAAASSIAAFRAPAALVGLTEYWDGVAYLGLLGAGSLLVASLLYHAVPSITGKKLFSFELARRHIRLVVAGVGLTSLLLMAAGVVRGFGWTGGSFSGAFADYGPGWGESAGPADLLAGLAILTGLVGLVGQGALVLNILRTLTSGHPDTAEVLVGREVRT